MDDTIGSVPWHALREAEIRDRLNTDLKEGISTDEAHARTTRFGANSFTRKERETFLSLLARQFRNPLVYILLFAGAAMLALGQFADSAIIFFVIAINAGIGLYQEGRAGRAFIKLQQSQERFATVIRDGLRGKIRTEEIVPGDIVLLSAGGYVPADIRLLSVNELAINESALTGEWLAVSKRPDGVRSDARITEQTNMAFMGTLVSVGFGMGVVVRIGNTTEIGRIAVNLHDGIPEDTPFQKSIKQLARFLSVAVAVLVALIFVVGLVRGQSFGDMLLISISVAVAAIPSGLPIAVTVVLAIGLEHILLRGGLVKNLVAAETLGGTTTIVTDKTGTLTHGDMRVTDIVAASNSVSDQQEMLQYAVLASDAYVEMKKGPEGNALWRVEGRPVERAIVLAGIESGFDKTALIDRFSCGQSRPFTSTRRVAAIVCSLKTGRHIVIVTGAPELLLEHSTRAHSEGRIVRLSSTMRKELETMHENEARQGTRFVAVAYRIIDDTHLPSEQLLLTNLVFGAYIALSDPLRADAKEAIRAAQSAGARVIMATGDYVATARRIAEDVGILVGSSAVVTGDAFAKMNSADKRDMASRVRVFARMLPDQKLELLEILKKQGEVVAMTGDGINDAPALESANIGIALGSGTEVAKEASDIVLINDSFSIIVSAIEEGRRIIDNLKKILAYLLSTAFGEIIVVGGALALGGPLPILPVQILWTNIIEEGFMTVAFAFEPSETDIMTRDPRSRRMRSILTRELKTLIAIIASMTGLLLVALYAVLIYMGFEIAYVRTIIFSGLAVDSIFYTFSIKNLHKPIWKLNIFSNWYLVFALAASSLALASALLFAPLRTMLHLEALDPTGMLLVLGIGIINLISIEGAKFAITRRYQKDEA